MSTHPSQVATIQPSLFDDWDNTPETAQNGTERPVPAQTALFGPLTPQTVSNPSQTVTAPPAATPVTAAHRRAAAQWNNHNAQTTILDFLDDDQPDLIALQIAETRTPITDTDHGRRWMEQGNCVIPTEVTKEQQQRMAAEVDAALWPEPDQFGRVDWSAGRELCHGCPVIEQCLKYAVASGSTEGMFGGLTPSERTHWTRNNIAKQAHTHGTRACYNSGCRCADCTEANRTYKKRNHLDKKSRDNAA